MDIIIREYGQGDLEEMIKIWNEVVEEGVAFPQREALTLESGEKFFAEQTYCGVAQTSDKALAGMYILHPNNVGRCGHIANASFAVSSKIRGEGIGRRLVLDCLKQAREHCFRIMQFNAVVKTNAAARALYEDIGFKPLGVIPNGFLLKNGSYEDICPYYYDLTKENIGK